MCCLLLTIFEIDFMIIRKVSYFKRDKLGYIFQKIVIKKFV